MANAAEFLELEDSVRTPTTQNALCQTFPFKFLLNNIAPVDSIEKTRPSIEECISKLLNHVSGTINTNKQKTPGKKSKNAGHQHIFRSQPISTKKYLHIFFLFCFIIVYKQ